jgi:hypothetical protein
VLTALQLEQQQQQQLQLSAADTLSLMEQLATIGRLYSAGASSSSSNSVFVEDQALQQVLPLVSLERKCPNSYYRTAAPTG